jgi:hypothetical protein
MQDWLTSSAVTSRLLLSIMVITSWLLRGLMQDWPPNAIPSDISATVATQPTFCYNRGYFLGKVLRRFWGNVSSGFQHVITLYYLSSTKNKYNIAEFTSAPNTSATKDKEEARRSERIITAAARKQQPRLHQESGRRKPRWREGRKGERKRNYGRRELRIRRRANPLGGIRHNTRNTRTILHGNSRNLFHNPPSIWICRSLLHNCRFKLWIHLLCSYRIHGLYVIIGTTFLLTFLLRHFSSNHHFGFEAVTVS